MSPQEIINVLFSFFGGGVVAAIAAALLSNRSESRFRRAEFIRSQLQELYGPLQFLTSSNAQLFKLTDKFSEAYDAEFVNKKWSENEITQERVSQSRSETIAISNEYIKKQVIENNGRILELLTNRYSFIDLADAEVFAQFVVDHTRYKTEWGESGLRTPIEIYNHVGTISYMRPEFIEAVDKRFREKQAELQKLLK